MYANYTPKDVARFWKKVDRSPHPKGCWLWTAYRNKDGYGMIKWGGRRVESGHRISYLLANGEFSDELFVLHKCDNPRCVNPEHLFLGTHQDNVDDRDNKNRQSAGENRPLHKITNEQAEEIRERCKNGAWGIQTKIGIEYGLSSGTVSLIARGKRYKS